MGVGGLRVSDFEGSDGSRPKTNKQTKKIGRRGLQKERWIEKVTEKEGG